MLDDLLLYLLYLPSLHLLAHVYIPNGQRRLDTEVFKDHMHQNSHACALYSLVHMPHNTVLWVLMVFANSHRFSA